MIDRFIIAAVLVVGALPGAGIMITSTIGEYEYFLPYRYAGIAFPLFSLLAGLFVFPLWKQTTTRRSICLRIFITAMVAYMLTWACLAIMNSTSLCIGLRNGDGTNSLAHCVAGTILNGTVFAVCALLGNVPGAVLCAFFYKKRGHR